MSTSVPLVSSSQLVPTSMRIPAVIHGEGAEVHMFEMRELEGIKPCVSNPQPQAGAGDHVREYKPNIRNMEVDQVLMGVDTKTEIH